MSVQSLIISREEAPLRAVPLLPELPTAPDRCDLHLVSWQHGSPLFREGDIVIFDTDDCWPEEGGCCRGFGFR